MKISKILRLTSLFLLFTGIQTVSAQYILNNNASEISCNCYELTSDVNSQSGSVWNATQIDLNNSFDYSFDVFLGFNDGGADGITFTLQQSGTNIGNFGGGLGILGITPSFIVEIDTYQNTGAAPGGFSYNDPPEDHIGILQNGDLDNTGANALAGPALLPNVEDGNWHVLRVVWDAATSTFTVYFDGVQQAQYTGDLINSIFGGDPMVYWGFTGSTGGLNNVQSFCTPISTGFSLAVTGEACVNSNNGQAILTNLFNTNNGQLTVTWTDPSGNTHDTQNISTGGNVSQTDLYSGLWQISVSSPLDNCVWDTSFVISAGSSVNITPNINHPQCYGTSNGSISAISNTAGTWSFSIKDSDGNIKNDPGTNTANVLPAGTYTVSVFDNNGCENSTTVVLNDPPPLNLSLSLTNPDCHGDLTGNAFVDTVYNYQGEYEEIYYGWDPNPNGTNGLNERENAGLGAGEYTIEIVDEIGCSNEFTFFIIEPNPLVGVVEIPSLTYCRTRSFQKGNGEVTVTTAGLDQSGTGNVTYHWENLENGDETTTTTFIVNEPGWMQVTLTDDNGCTYIEQVYVDSLTPIADFDLVSEGFHGPGEYEGTEDLEVELINTSLYFSKPSYELSDSTSRITWYNNEPGNENGNWFFRYDYNITKTDTVLRAVGDTETNYEVCLVAKNFNDCRDTTCKILTVHPFPGIEVPNVFTPGATPNNEFFFPARGIGEFDCGVFNRYGVEVYHFNSINDKWDGTNAKNGRDCLDGVYFYSYNATSTNGTKFDGQGNVHLIRYKD